MERQQKPHPDWKQDAMYQLTSLRQGNDSVRSYVTKFFQLAILVRWNDSPLMHYFQLRLSDPIKDILVMRDDPKCLNDMMTLAMRIDCRLKEREKERELEAATTASKSSNYRSSHQTKNIQTCGIALRDEGKDPNPTDLQEIWSKLPDKQRRYLTRLVLKQCIYCGASEHRIAKCPIKPPKEEGKGKAQK